MREPEVNFDTPPPVGTEIEADGLSFSLLAVEPYVRQRDGVEIAMLVWRGRCADCGEPFEARTPLRTSAITKRCPQHRAKGKPATEAAQARLDASRITWARHRTSEQPNGGRGGKICNRRVGDG
jgi:hypothetical protein